MAKILLFDVESTDLDADFGTALAFGYKFLDDKKPRVLSITEYYPPCKKCGRVATDTDKLLIEDAHKIISSSDMLVSWYGKGFDIPFLNTRAVEAGLPPLPPIPHVDLYFTARTHLKLSSNRLASAQDFLQLPVSKTAILKRTWREAQAGIPSALKYVVDHCEKDVLVLEGAYLKLRPFVLTHPRVAGLGPCRVCGSTKLQKRGLSLLVSTKTPRQRVQCSSCGASDYRPLDDSLFKINPNKKEEAKEA